MPLSDADRFAELVDADLLHADDAEHGDHHAAGNHDEQSYSAQTGGLLALVGALRSLEFDVSPSDLTRGRHRQRLVAMAAVRTTEVPDQAETGRHRPSTAPRMPRAPACGQPCQPACVTPDQVDG